MVKAHNLVCPIDGIKLEFGDKQLVCANGHTFDIARQGYVNLLAVQHKRSKQPGDSKVMVRARTRFLNAGFYRPIANLLTDLVVTQIANDKTACLMDAGCGEGYYFNAIFNCLSAKEGDNDLAFIGLDISKEAIAQAAKRNKQISWVVGTNRLPPVDAASIDIILCLFGFYSFEGFNKALKPGGKIILLDPGPDHLRELRAIIYPAVKTTNSAASFSSETEFLLLNKQQLQFKIKLTSQEQINNLLLMTPHFYRAKKSFRDIARNLQELELTIEVIVRLLEKTPIDS